MSAPIQARSHSGPATQAAPVSGCSYGQDHAGIDTQVVGVLAAFSGPDQCSCDTHPGSVGSESSPTEPIEDPVPKVDPARLGDLLLAVHANTVDELEALRIATDNRLRQFTDILAGSPELVRMRTMSDDIAVLEHRAILDLQRAMRKHPLGPWVKATVGVGEKQAARLLAAIGDPYWHLQLDRPRTVSELWSYCGMGVVNGEAPRRRKGQKSNWNETARKRIRLISESCIKHANSPYRAAYDAGRTRYADATHQSVCVRCGPAGYPADVGTPLNDGHKHARALRLVAKQILADIWRESGGLQGADVAPPSPSPLATTGAH